MLEMNAEFSNLLKLLYAFCHEGGRIEVTEYSYEQETLCVTFLDEDGDRVMIVPDNEEEEAYQVYAQGEEAKLTLDQIKQWFIDE